MDKLTVDSPDNPFELFHKSSEKIKPCPFCGNTKVTVVLGTGFTVRCLNCGASVPTNARKNTVDAIKIWNTRYE